MKTQKHNAKFYRGISPELRDAIKKLAHSLCVNADEIARAFLEAAIQALRNGDLELEPRPYSQRMTLFPEDEKKGWTYSQLSLLPGDVSPFINPALLGETKRWKFTATYRIPDHIHEMLRFIADEYQVGVGSLVSYFLQWGIQEYHAGKLRLSPRALTIKQGMFFTGASI